MLEAFQDLRRFGITLAPETAAPRLRNVINKNVPLENIFRAVDLAQEFGWRHMKLYFMIGLPSETREDFLEIPRVLREIHGRTRRLGFKVSLSPFVPRPHTPFQWERAFEPEEWDETIRLIRAETRDLNRIKITWHEPEKSALEAVLARGDERLSEVVLTAYRNGATFDDRSERFDFGIWEQAFRTSDIPWRSYLAERDPHTPLPWEHIDVGVTRDLLLGERDRSQRAEPTADCLEEGCNECGPWYEEGNEVCRGGLKVEMPPRVPTKPLPDVTFSYLLEYEKDGDMRWISHLDVMRTIIAALRRSGIVPAYSHGFVPHPMISLGPALVLGAEGRSEWFAIKGPKVEANDLIDRLNLELPVGLRVLRAWTIKGKPPWNTITRALYEVTLEPDIILPDLKEFQGSRTLSRRTKKGEGKEVRASDVVSSLSVDGRTLALDLRLGTGIGPLEVLSALTGRDPEKCRGMRIVRIGLATDSGSFDTGN
jgi:radical SAM-linked protein